jgi:two-component system CheB/CheR fusion protein
VANAERALSARVVDTVREPLLVLDGALRVVLANPAFHLAFQTTTAGVIGRHVYDLADRRWDLPALRELLELVLPRDQSFQGFAVKGFSAEGKAVVCSLDGQRIVGRDGAAQLILLSFRS